MRLALAPINPTVGDLAGNVDLILGGIAKAKAAGAEIVVFPELALCGYPPRDLLLEEGFVQACADAAKRLGEHHTPGITAIFGTPLPLENGGVANSLLVYQNNTFAGYYDKQLLPTYDVFDEDRYFRSGADRLDKSDRADRAYPTYRPHPTYPTSAWSHRPPFVLGLAICEDLWKGEDAGFADRYRQTPDPVLTLIARGVNLVLSPSASPFVLGKGYRHRDILQHHARTHGIFVASVNQFGGNDDLIFDGHTLVYEPGGDLIGEGRLFSGEQLLIDLPLPEGGGRGVGSSDSPARTNAAKTETPLADFPPAPHSATSSKPTPNPLPQGGGPDLLFPALTLGIRDYLRKTGFKKAILGLSGGIDSALTAALAVRALGPDNVLGVAMPGRYSSQHSVADAIDLSHRLGIHLETISIDQPFAAFSQTLNTAFAALHQSALGASLPDLTEENLQSRIRGSILMALSNRSGAMVLTTGNKSELAVGYCTLYGDMNGGLAVLSDVTKHLVYQLARYINEHHAACGFTTPPIPQSSIDKAPSAELRPNQTDQDSLPPYDMLDEIIRRHVEQHQSSAAIITETGLEAATVERIVRLIYLTEYKRKQAAVGLKVTTVAFGTGRRMPIAHRWR